MHSEKPRLFLAVPARLGAYKTIRRDFETLVEGRWTPEEQLHATLCFFGTRYETAELLERLESIDFSVAPSGLTSLGFFKRSNILYAGSDNPSLEHLYKDISAALELPERPFTPHVTLMRVKKILDAPAFYSMLKRCGNRPLGQLEDRVALYVSELRSEGAYHTLLKEWKSLSSAAASCASNCPGYPPSKAAEASSTRSKRS